MPSDKEIKKEFKKKASENPDDYYATGVLKKEGFSRRKCTKCDTFFWTVTDSEVCGDPACSGGFRFIDDTPATNKLDYIGVWKKFSELFSKWGYTPIDRYPVAARWRNDTEFVQASIYDFQPYVVSGEVDPPANPLVVPQMCLRFNDIDNIGITGAHYCAFVMIGQHAFMKPEDWSQEKYFTDIHNWLKQGLGLPNEEITFHEDAWAGGGNFGPCMEYFSRGLELGNQVYMLYEQTPKGNQELKLKVLDMGMGHERNAWFTQGTSTSYETTFPTVCKKLRAITGVVDDPVLMQKFLPFSSYLNVDEVDDINATWKLVADKISIDVTELKKKIHESAALYSVGEHTRALLVALSDGVLPSNVGGGYNLRFILRRALSLIDQYKWQVDLPEVCKWHAEYLKPLFPELDKNLSEVTTILEVEKKKYEATKEKTKSVVGRFVTEDFSEDKKVVEEKLLVLYDSYGITPELVREEATKLGKEIEVPDNFYSRVAERHEREEQKHATQKEEKLDFTGVPDTVAKYFDDYSLLEFEGSVVKIIDNNVMLSETYFYPTSGGQVHDVGLMNGVEVVDVFKQGGVIVHVLKDAPTFGEGDTVSCTIDKDRRFQLAKHHTATHIINYAAQKVLGNHINQAGAKKDIEYATIDLTHYESLSDDVLRKIETIANDVVNSGVEIHSSFMPRTDAEKAYGVRIYQGGAVPGKSLRIVDIKGIDTEACGGTHLHNTSEVGSIKILKSSKISDSIVRLYFTAGEAARAQEEGSDAIAHEAAKLLGVSVECVPARAAELFSTWKKVKKAKKKGKELSSSDFTLTSTETFDGDVVSETAKLLKTQPEHVVKTIGRFMDELKGMENS